MCGINRARAESRKWKQHWSVFVCVFFSWRWTLTWLITDYKSYYLSPCSLPASIDTPLTLELRGIASEDMKPQRQRARLWITSSTYATAVTFSSGCCDGCEWWTICTLLEPPQDERQRGQRYTHPQSHTQNSPNLGRKMFFKLFDQLRFSCFNKESPRLCSSLLWFINGNILVFHHFLTVDTLPPELVVPLLAFAVLRLEPAFLVFAAREHWSECEQITTVLQIENKWE